MPNNDEDERTITSVRVKRCVFEMSRSATVDSSVTNPP